ncbi:MAG: helix-turn-helix domain-containing protein [Oscillospiraceae bacterium]|nr:helix-turn-helix domain-containing protein [Oscillospiraceae bacterium]
MREFDAKLLSILKTETAMERLLRRDPEERARFVQKVYEGGRDDRIAHELKDNVSVTRLLRFTPSMPRRSGLIEMLYVITGSVHMQVGEQALTLHQGDFFLPNQYTVTSWDALGEDDIAVCFVMNTRFLEDTCVKLKTTTVLSQFMLDTLRRDISWNQYLHFTGVEDIAVHNIAETLVFGAFPYLDDTNIACGSSLDPALTGDLMCALFMSLSRNLSALTEGSPSNYTEILRQTICDYIGREYRTASLQELACMVHQSESALSRQIKEIFGYNFKDLLLQKRFERALILLEQTELPIADIAQSVGYENTSFFYRRFRQIYGISPKDYRPREK